LRAGNLGGQLHQRLAQPLQQRLRSRLVPAQSRELFAPLPQLGGQRRDGRLANRPGLLQLDFLRVLQFLQRGELFRLRPGRELGGRQLGSRVPRLAHPGGPRAVKIIVIHGHAAGHGRVFLAQHELQALLAAGPEGGAQLLVERGPLPVQPRLRLRAAGGGLLRALPLLGELPPHFPQLARQLADPLLRQLEVAQQGVVLVACRLLLELEAVDALAQPCQTRLLLLHRRLRRPAGGPSDTDREQQGRGPREGCHGRAQADAAAPTKLMSERPVISLGWGRPMMVRRVGAMSQSEPPSPSRAGRLPT